MRRTQTIITGLDVGTTKVCAVIGEVTATGVDVIGIGKHPSRGLRKGVVANVDGEEAEKEALRTAEYLRRLWQPPQSEQTQRESPPN